MRFYNAVSLINDNTSIANIEQIVDDEVSWVENDCLVNMAQRKKYRAVWLLFRDLIRASWKACFREGVLEMRLPNLDQNEIQDASTPEIKSLLRSWMQESRLERLLSYTDFITRMEAPAAGKKDISCLIADGSYLADKLQNVLNHKIPIEDAVSPYLQLVKENERDTFTGLKLSDIWRYFRLTWSTPAETTPGRTMQYLIRDAAHPMHAVMGIASLENCAMQITCRDDDIGWTPKSFTKKLRSFKELKDVYREFERLLSFLEEGIQGIDYQDLCSEAEILNPSEETVKALQFKAAAAEEERQYLLKLSQSEKRNELEEKSELGSISRETENALYLRKRAEQLSRLLQSKKQLNDLVLGSNFEHMWLSFAESETGYSAIRTALIAQKGKHIGSSMMELNICGAVPPYNEILGGKLVALLATSPQVIHDYYKRYDLRRSEIASRLKGEDVRRSAELVYVGTTSLYYVGSSQYNRLKVPKEILESDFDIQWRKLGMTYGFGTMHISKATTMSLTEATSDIGFTRINHVFGEGASPKMRLMNMSIRELLETNQDEAKELSKHAMSRIVYGAALAKNTKEYLLGLEEKPNYGFDIEDYMSGTKKIINYWQQRWVLSRLRYSPIFDRIRAFDKTAFLVSTDIKKQSDWKFERLKEALIMHYPENDRSVFNFINGFYRGSSAYADNIDNQYLSQIHVVTELDAAIIDAVSSGKDVVLTGNPGDGKTHIIRMLLPELSGLPRPPRIEIDASTLSNEEIFEHWSEAKQSGVPFVIAINAAVLFSLSLEYADFRPIAEAKAQMINSTVFHNESFEFKESIVFDLSKREALSPSIVKRVIDNLTNKSNFEGCGVCQFTSSCEVLRNAELLKNTLFQDRLSIILTRVALQGHHATLRELFGFVSYLLFGNRTCEKMHATFGENEFDLVNLIYSGKGALFDAVRQSFDPARVSHPIWDERLLQNSIDKETWVEGVIISSEAIDVNNVELFKLRKRQFYFFNTHGEALLSISDDDVSKFQAFLAQDNKRIIKELIRKLNAFFGLAKPGTELEIWLGHRFNNSSRRILVSLGRLSGSQFCIGRPQLNSLMSQGIEMTQNYLRLEKLNAPSIYLKIDFSLYCLLLEAERGVPVLFMENDNVKKVWRFIEQLQTNDRLKEEDEIAVTLLDVQGKKEINVTIDRDSRKYLSIQSGGKH
ncbi:Druantia anti-phage system protein DruA [Paenibacillus konkukensis]|nr:Druantia anti-phage system protein DruA [Paenibacillus konkukensis]